MTGCVQADIGCNEHVVSNGYRCTIQYNQTMIGKKVFADMNITAVIAPEIRQNGKCTIGAAQQLNKQLVALRFPGNRQMIDLPANFLGSYAFLC